MGGCCCCSSKETELSDPPAYFYHPRASEERVPLSSNHGSASAFSRGLLVDTNLETSSPDTYRPPPVPVPYSSVTLVAAQTPPRVNEISENKTNASLQSTNPNSVQEIVTSDGHGNLTKLEEQKELEGRVQSELELDSAKDSEIELQKLEEPVILAEEEDVCPICLEEYDAENPKLSTKCDHHFHLACILEWMERSESCPVCDKDVVFESPID
ncbi:probable E3 ubiquitin-protein ligase RHB1A isoform X1 [Prosopis cineraria]|uniref:probable E3 ubiquitin-protein ligase RHB1A isoform X1 n=1 Tax=Prosopis cineraria TaxID=364024 RepID=UPI00240F50CB|nr:probable E3 ubiquitin-protein ligase RHB1A isoform X1 [Prosopis cineraria]XP_054825742.1 probable E3 ubiquitin-protein ligase RHB1A isoform X1 [Prosopis cineraria]XP_054825743.1 probable E3 ubiquitin-protein ligase RHB1A isoform X1 [Prosopis cineraria]XP_054825744.1 probable E3 ubiquitin-protein ligase RHB1A isoform X1 [Prosopis cineraria]XP_054825746.1 probable E3 ubiquitin-protein ligase RHB1A isoform X1 [Prosopis cineraria]